MYPKRETHMFKILRTFESVYRTRSFTKSAEELFFSQSTVSKHVKWLENIVDQELFIRQGANPLLATRAGEEIHEAAAKILTAWDDTLAAVKVQETNIPSYLIGASHSFAAIYLSPLIKHLMEENDHKINFELQIMNSSMVMDALETNEIHFGFIEKPLSTSSVHTFKLVRDELVLAGDAHSDLWLLREKDSGVRLYTETYMQERNIHEKVMVVNSNQAILNLLHEGLGKSIVSKSLIGDLPYRPLTNHYIRHFYLVDRVNDYHSQILVSQILAYFDQLSSETP